MQPVTKKGNSFLSSKNMTPLSQVKSSSGNQLIKQNYLSTLRVPARNRGKEYVSAEPKPLYVGEMRAPHDKKIRSDRTGTLSVEVVNGAWSEEKL